jgi:hypothetical protein
MNRLDVVGMVISPRPSHTAGTDVVRNDVVIIRKQTVAESASTVLGDDLPVHELPHFRIGTDLPVPARVLGIVDAADSHLPPSSVLWYHFPAAAK